jgi:hypothetical protein
MKHNLDSFSILSRLTIIAPENSDIKKSHIYSAFKEKGGVIACTFMNKYVRQSLKNAKEAEFTLWAVGMTETISREEKIHLKLKTLLALPAYVGFKQNNQELKDLLEKLGIKSDDQQFNAAKTLDQQVTEAKQILKNTTEPYLKTRELMVNAITTNLQYIYLRVPSIKCLKIISYVGRFEAEDVYVKPDPFYGFWREGHHYMRLRDLASGDVIVVAASDFDLVNNQNIAALTPTILVGKNLRTRLNQLDLNMQLFLRNFTLKYKEAIKIDAELSLAMNTWRQRLQQFNAQFSAIAKLDKKQQGQENRTLKLLAEKLLPLIDYSVEKELEKFQVMQP